MSAFTKESFLGLLPDMTELEVMARDVSPRHYFRAHRQNGSTAIIMAYPSPDEKSLKELEGFIKISAWMAQRGLRVPALIAHDEAHAMAAFEDLGRTSFGKVLHGGLLSKDELYETAAEPLTIIRDIPATECEWLPSYYKSYIHYNRRDLVTYYAPLKTGKKSDDALMESYLAAWEKIEKSLPLCPMGFVHGDYHLENLMYIEGGKNPAERCALIDYQDAMYGPLPYDLVNLLEDARVSVPVDIQQRVLEHYCAPMNKEQEYAFRSWYRVLGTQFHCRVIGLFIKLAQIQGRDQYLVHVPRLQDYIAREIEDPILLPLKEWFAASGIDFKALDLQGLQLAS